MPDADKPDTIVDHHTAILDYALFAEGYTRLKGYTLEGEPVEITGESHVSEVRGKHRLTLYFMAVLLLRRPRQTGQRLPP